MGKIVTVVGTVLMAVGVICLFAACGGSGGGGSVSDGTVTSSVQSQGVRYALSANAVSRQGENVTLTLTTTNTGTAPLDLASTLSALTMQVYDKDGAQVWGSQSGTSGAFRKSGTLAPGASYDYVVTWDQSDSRGRSGVDVGPGNYLVKATDGTSNVQVTITVSGAAANSLTIVPGAVDGNFVVQANNLSGVAGMDLSIGYDNTQLSSPTVTQGAFITGAMMAANTTVPGTIRIAIVSATSISGSGPLATITFANLARNHAAPTISSVSLIDSSGQTVQ